MNQSIEEVPAEPIVEDDVEDDLDEDEEVEEIDNGTSLPE